MIKVVFKTLYAEGFRSIGKISLNLADFKGINLLKAVNGMGKTTLIESIYWCIYGKTLKGTTSNVQTWEKYRTDNYQGTKVLLAFEVNNDDYIIARTQKYKGTINDTKLPSGLMLLQKTADGLIPVSSQHKKDIQESIITLLGIDSNTFLNSILFGQRMQKFIQGKADDKRAFFDQVFELGFLADAKQKAELQHNKISKAISDLNQKIKNLQVKFQANQTTITTLEKHNSTWEQEHQKEILEIQSRLKASKESIDKVQTSLDNRPVIEFDMDAYNDILNNNSLQTLTETRGNIEKINNAKTAIESKINATCKSCGNSFGYTKDELKEAKKQFTILDNKSKELLERSIVEDKAYKDHLVQKEAMMKLKTIYNQEQDVVRNLTQNIQIKSSTYKSIEQELARCQAKIKPDTTKIEELREANIFIDADLELLYPKVEKLTGYLEKVNWWIKVGFGANGVKNFMFNAMLQKLNQYVHKYATRLGIVVQFQVDLEKTRKTFKTLVSKDGDIRTYEEFSGGEQSRVDIALAFGLHDMLSSSITNMSVLFLDEFFEGLDEEGMYQVFDLLREKSESCSIFVITHNKQLDLRNSKTISIIKEDGLTSIM